MGEPLDLDTRIHDRAANRRWQRPLLGRDAEVVAVRTALQAGALVSITGLGGVGKTSLALAAVESAAGGRAVFVVDLAAVPDVREVPAILAARVSGFPATARDTFEAAAAVLAVRPAILLLDNVEHLDLRDAVEQLRTHAPTLAILTTSRVRLGVDGEHEIPIGPLPTRSEIAGVSAPAVALFRAMAADRGRNSADGPDDEEVVLAICERLGGLPLAIELCAGWTSILTPSAILRRLDAGTLPLEDPDRGSRQASLDAILDSTLSVLDVRDRAAFDAFTVFAGPFDEPAASAVVDQSSAADGLRTIRRLADVGLVRTLTDPAGEPRFEIPAALRPIAARGRDPETDQMIRHRHARHQLDGARAASHGFRRGSALEAVAWFERHDTDLRRAMAWAAQADHDLNVALVVEQAHWWRLTYRLDHGEAWISRVLAMLGDDDHEPLAVLSAELAWIRMRAGEPGDIDRLTTVAIAAGAAAGRPDLEAEARIARAVCARPEDAPQLLERAVALAEVAGLPVIAATAQNNLGIEYSRRGRAADALAAFEAAARSATATDDRLLQARAWGNLGMELLVAHRGSVALEVLDRAVELEATLGPDLARPSFHDFRAIGNAAVGAIGPALDDLEAARSRLPDWSPDEVRRHLESSAIVLSMAAPEAAARCLGAVGWSDHGAPDGRPRQSLLDEAAARIDQAIGDVRLALALRDGRVAGPSTILNELRVAPRGALPGARHGPFGRLTQREEEVLNLLGRGASDVEIAAKLYISPKTVSVHMSNLKAKLGVRTRVEAALQAHSAAAVRLGPDSE